MEPAVVPYYFLVWYNWRILLRNLCVAVVPYYFLVWYNYKVCEVVCALL